ncbi:MAG TPA: glutamate racemase [Firmicutes bacterium]|nr:glutamate racemase [Bacillota bacterium]
MSILFFDSGMGGITVLAEAMTLLPGEHYWYYADTAHVPYGNRSPENVRNLVIQIMDKIIPLISPEAVVIACNTATSVAIDSLRKRFTIPVIGMEPAVKPAVEKEKERGRRVLVLATSLTLSQKKYSHLVSRLNSERIVDSLPLPELVRMAEEELFDSDSVISYLKESFCSLDLIQYGTVVLGCTHFPFFKDEIASFFTEGTPVIDGNAGTVKQLKRVLNKDRSLTANERNKWPEFMSSGDVKKDKEKFSRLLRRFREERRVR